MFNKKRGEILLYWITFSCIRLSLVKMITKFIYNQSNILNKKIKLADLN